MTDYTVGNERLLQLADRIDSDKRVLGGFNFCRVCEIQRGPDNACGTVGCAMGEMPGLWPEVFTWAKYSERPYLLIPVSLPEVMQTVSSYQQLYVRSIHDYNDDYDYDGNPDVDAWFQLTEDQGNLLFYPANSPDDYDYDHVCPGIEQLPEDATAHEVAENLRAFVKARS